MVHLFVYQHDEARSFTISGRGGEHRPGASVKIGSNGFSPVRFLEHHNLRALQDGQLFQSKEKFLPQVCSDPAGIPAPDQETIRPANQHRRFCPRLHLGASSEPDIAGAELS